MFANGPLFLGASLTMFADIVGASGIPVLPAAAVRVHAECSRNVRRVVGFTVWCAGVSVVAALLWSGRVVTASSVVKLCPVLVGRGRVLVGFGEGLLACLCLTLLLPALVRCTVAVPPYTFTA